MKLTKSAIDQMVFEGKNPTSRDARWDDEIPGFGVRVWPSGKKTYVLSYWFGGKKAYKTLGATTVVSLQQAREMAKVAKIQVLAGRDPSARRTEMRDGKTFGDLADAYVTRHAAHKKSRKDDVSILDIHILPAWRGRLLSSLKRADVATLHHKIGEKTPVRANRALSLLSKIFNCARDWGFVPETALNPTAGIQKFREKERERFVTPDEMRRLGTAIESEENIYARAALWAYLLTGMRKSELLRIKWSQVDFDRREIRLADTKAGRPHIVPVTTHLEALLRRLPRMASNPHVFCGRDAGEQLHYIQGPWQRVRKTAGLDDVWLHDLRRTVGTWLVNSGASLPLIGRVLNHSNPKTTQRYARYQLAPAAEALEAHGRQLHLALAPAPGEGQDPDSMAASDSRTASAV